MNTKTITAQTQENKISVEVETTTAKKKQGWTNTNSTTTYHIDYVRGFITMHFDAAHCETEILSQKSYYENHGAVVMFTDSDRIKFYSATDRIIKKKLSK